MTDTEPAAKKPRKKASGPSPTQRSLKLLREEGWQVAIVEHWNMHARIRQDLFGFIDVLALKGSETLAVQATSDNLGGHGPERVRKILAAPTFPAVLAAGWRVEVWAWWKNAAGKWERRVTNVHGGMVPE